MSDLGRASHPYCGLRIVEDPRMTRTVEDWSGVRSPARARRRRRQGHPQRIRLVTVPFPHCLRIGETLVIHPAVAADLRREIEVAGRTS